MWKTKMFKQSYKAVFSFLLIVLLVVVSPLDEVLLAATFMAFMVDVRYGIIMLVFVCVFVLGLSYLIWSNARVKRTFTRKFK